MEDNPRFAVKVKIELEDMIHIHQVTLRSKIRIFNSQGFFILLLPLLLSIIVYLVGIYKKVETEGEFSVEGIEFPWQILVWSVVLIIYLILPTIMEKGVAKRFHNNKKLQSEIEYIITRDELSGYSEYEEFRYPWDIFYQFTVTKQSFLLYFSNDIVIPLPKRCFTNEEEVNAVRKLIKESMKGNKYQRIKE